MKRCETALDRKGKSQTRNIPLIYIHIFRIREKEMPPFSIFGMKRHWPERIYQYAFKPRRRQTRYTPLIYLHAFRIRKKGNVSFFLIRYETALNRKTYTIILVRPRDDKRAIYHWSISMHFEVGKKKREISPLSLFAMKRVGQKTYIIMLVGSKDDKRNVSFLLIRNETKMDKKNNKKTFRWQTRYIPLICRHAFRIRKQ